MKLAYVVEHRNSMTSLILSIVGSIVLIVKVTLGLKFSPFPTTQTVKSYITQLWHKLGSLH